MIKQINEEYGLSARDISNIHICKECKFFRPSAPMMACSGESFDMMAYCAWNKTEFCLGKLCENYEVKDEAA